MYDDEESDEIEFPSQPFRPIDALVLLVDFLDNIALAFQSLTSKLLWKIAAHKNHTIDCDDAEQAADSTVQII